MTACRDALGKDALGGLVERLHGRLAVGAINAVGGAEHEAQPADGVVAGDCKDKRILVEDGGVLERLAIQRKAMGEVPRMTKGSMLDECWNRPSTPSPFSTHCSAFCSPWRRI